jgi:hypothetical protein
VTRAKKPPHLELPQPYRAMTKKELEADAARFDREFIVRESHPLSPELERRWKKASRKRGRPRVGKGARKVLVSIERDLLRRSDAFARQKKISRSQLIAQSLQAVLEAKE